MTEVVKSRKQLYSTWQAFIASFLGGFIAAGRIFNNNSIDSSEDRFYYVTHVITVLLVVDVTYLSDGRGFDSPAFLSTYIAVGSAIWVYSGNVSEENFQSKKKNWYDALEVGVGSMLITFIIIVVTIQIMKVIGITN